MTDPAPMDLEKVLEEVLSRHVHDPDLPEEVRDALDQLAKEVQRYAVGVCEDCKHAYVGQKLSAGCSHCELDRMREALSELVECADLRGDSDLPHPADDPLLWTARMQEAWDNASAALAEEEPTEPNAAQAD